jgi:hypothetical protein
MSKSPSDATMLRRCKSDLNRARNTLNNVKIDYAACLASFHKATKERDEWKERFDALLRRDGEKI